MIKQVTNEESKEKFWNIRQLFKKNKSNKKNDIISKRIKSQ
jgi:hypothetical protein